MRGRTGYDKKGIIRTQRTLTHAVLTTALLIAGGAAWAVTKQCEPNRTCWGTRHNDKLTGTDGRDNIAGWAGKDKVIGLAGPDLLNGGKGEDDLRGGKGNDSMGGGNSVEHDSDRLYGGRGDDHLFGGGGIDTLYGNLGDDFLLGGESGDNYVFETSWGRDRIKDPRNYRNTVWLTDVTSDLLISLFSSKKRPEVKTDDGASKINWRNDDIRSVVSGRGDDIIEGNDTRNVIQAQFGGSDTVTGGDGNDTINVRDLSSGPPGSDTVDCGPGDNDKVFYDEGTDTITNCEQLNPDQ